MGLLNSLQTLIKPSPGPAPAHPGPGVYYYLRETGEGKARLHLRMEPDGSALLLVNASRVYQLNASAGYMAFLSLEEAPATAAITALTRRYRVSKRQAQQDYSELCAQLDILTNPNEHCALCELDLETTRPFSARPSAPYRMDLALTYRCNNNCAHCYNARPRQQPELTTTQWKGILDRLWAIGIPHIVFTGGEPTLRPDLPELIAHAEHNGQITGINTNGRRLKDPNFADSLVAAGLDHVQITFESHLPAIHDQMVCANGAWQDTLAGIRNVLARKMFVMTNTTLLQPNAAHLAETLDFLASLGVPTIGLNALIYSGRGKEVDSGLPEAALPPLLKLARDKTDAYGQRLIWYTPTQYCHFDPILLDLGVKGCSAALYNMCIEPEGSVIPCQSYYQPVGNLTRDSWDSIWNHSLSTSLRERTNLPVACMACTLLQECGGGCPLARQANPDLRPQTIYATYQQNTREAE